MLKIRNKSHKNLSRLRRDDYNWDSGLKVIKVYPASGRMTIIEIFNNCLLNSTQTIKIYPALGRVTKIEILNYCLLNEFSMKAIKIYTASSNYNETHKNL